MKEMCNCSGREAQGVRQNWENNLDGVGTVLVSYLMLCFRPKGRRDGNSKALQEFVGTGL
jgi:hypothetical protein